MTNVFTSLNFVGAKRKADDDPMNVCMNPRYADALFTYIVPAASILHFVFKVYFVFFTAFLLVCWLSVLLFHVS